MSKGVFEHFSEKAFRLCDEKGLLEDKVIVRAKVISADEAIGKPEGKDFPLQKGRERLMQAEFRGSIGQAFTDQFGDFEGSVKELFLMSISDNCQRAVFVAAVNAIMKYLGLVKGTVHCRDEGPSQCASLLIDQLSIRYQQPKILQVGFQPKFAEALASYAPLRVLDLDPENIGTHKYGLKIEGPESTSNAVLWADLLIVTGTTLVNDTIHNFLVEKPTIFYGTTIAGASRLMGWERFCPKST